MKRFLVGRASPHDKCCYERSVAISGERGCSPYAGTLQTGSRSLWWYNLDSWYGKNPPGNSSSGPQRVPKEPGGSERCHSVYPDVLRGSMTIILPTRATRTGISVVLPVSSARR